MKTMSDTVATGGQWVTYTGFFYWLGNLLNAYTPEQWTAIGVIGTLLISLLGGLTRIAFGVWDRCSEARRAARRDAPSDAREAPYDEPPSAG